MVVLSALLGIHGTLTHAGLIAPSQESVALGLGRASSRLVESFSSNVMSSDRIVHVVEMTFRVRIRNGGPLAVVVNDWDFDLVSASGSALPFVPFSDPRADQAAPNLKSGDFVIVPAGQSRTIELIRYANRGVRRRLALRVELHPTRIEDWNRRPGAYLAQPGFYPGALKEIQRRMRAQKAVELRNAVFSPKSWIDFG